MVVSAQECLAKSAVSVLCESAQIKHVPCPMSDENPYEKPEPFWGASLLLSCEMGQAAFIPLLSFP